jgi:predicted transcriptional regulator
MQTNENEINLQEELDYIDALVHYGTPQLFPGDPHGSGRYREGSGDTPNQHGSTDFLARLEDLRNKGMTDTEIARYLGMTTTQLRSDISSAYSARRAALVERAKALHHQGKGATEIARIMNLSGGESAVRSLLNENSERRMKKTQETIDQIKKAVDEQGIVDVGTGVNISLGISSTRMINALKSLEKEGYFVGGIRVEQATNKGKWTIVKVVGKPGTQQKDVYKLDEIGSMIDFKSDPEAINNVLSSFKYPVSINPSRVMIRYAEEGGINKDGVAEIRRGVKDLYLGDGVNYSQVRILVNNSHYIKGMAVYGDDKDFPKGVDIIFNTNKHIGTPMCGEDKNHTVLKPIKKDDPNNPFGSAIKAIGGQSVYIDDDGTTKQSAINKRANEGDWGEWSKELPSQFLAKQQLQLIRRQLKISENESKDELEDIMKVTNPTVRRQLLEDFASNCDSRAVHLKAAALPGQRYEVILPLVTIKDNEVYAPNFKDGSELALVRFPHAGTFELPILKVNNSNPEGKRVIGTDASDAVGISPATAARLSGADFDGDTVLAIPLTNKTRIHSSDPLPGLKGFEPKDEYGFDDVRKDPKTGEDVYYRNGKPFKTMTKTQLEMGIISNLITDMTLRGASKDELAAAVRHSMVVIDAEKHHLDYKASELDNNIASLKKKYQVKVNEDGTITTGGASTLLSRAKSPVNNLPEREEGQYFLRTTDKKVYPADDKKHHEIFADPDTGEVYTRDAVKRKYVDPETGERLYTNTNRLYYKVGVTVNGKLQKRNAFAKDGKLYYKDEDGTPVLVTTEKVYKKLAPQKGNVSTMSTINDARVLSTGTPQEEAYADYANSLKSLANTARKEALITKDIPYSPSAKKTYEAEVQSINEKYTRAMMNAPKERKAQLLANSELEQMKANNPQIDSDSEHWGKISQQVLQSARIKVGAHRDNVEFTPAEWTAIQAGAITPSKLKNILKHADMTIVKKLAMPKDSLIIGETKINRMKSLSASGYTNAEIADILGISTSTVIKYMKGKGE